MIAKNWFANFDKNQRFATLSAFLLVWVMMICILQICVSVAEHIYPGWSGSYVLWFGGIVSFVAMFVNYIVNERAEKIRLVYRVSEILIILLSAKLVQIIQSGGRTAFPGLFDWSLFFNEFFSGGFLFLFFFMLLIWGLSNAYARDIYALQSYISDLELGGFIQLRSERITARIHIANMFLAVGVVLIILVSLARLDLTLYANVIGKALSIPLGISIIPLMIYFLSGLILLSLSQFAILRGAWLMGNVPIAPKVAVNWLRYSLIIFGFAGLVIIFLPTEYSVNLLESALIILNYLFEALLFLLGLFIFPFVFIYSFILSIFGKNSPPDAKQMMPDFEVPPDRTTPGALPPWLELAKNILFWSILTAVMLYFLWHYIRQNKSWLSGLQWRGLRAWIESMKKWFRLLFPKIRRQINKLIAFRKMEKIASESNASKNWRSKFIDFRKMSSREKILYYYETFLEESEKLGIGKTPSQTPAQYASQLQAVYPEQVDQLDLLTNGFITARYSGKLEMDAEANQIKRVSKILIKQFKLLENNQGQ